MIPQIGDIISWLNCPVAVIGPSRFPSKDTDNPMMTCAYLAAPNYFTGVKAGQILGEFHIKDKTLWTEPLTDEQLVLYTKLMLMGAT